MQMQDPVGGEYGGGGQRKFSSDCSKCYNLRVSVGKEVLRKEDKV